MVEVVAEASDTDTGHVRLSVHSVKEAVKLDVSSEVCVVVANVLDNELSGSEVLTVSRLSFSMDGVFGS